MNNGQVKFIYDGDGNRVAKIKDGTTTNYLVDELNPTGYPQVVEEIVGGTVTRRYTYGVNLISQTQLTNGTWNTSFYEFDGQGDVRQLTDINGSITDTYTYDAFGNLLEKTGNTPNNYLYNGEQFDPDLGCYYFRARYYNPQTGRFMSRDPFFGFIDDPMSLHRYLYADADPVNLYDPSGLQALTEYSMVNKQSTRPENTSSLSSITVVVYCIFAKTTAALESLADVLELTGVYRNDALSYSLMILSYSGSQCNAEFKVLKVATEYYKGSKLARNMYKAGRGIVKGKGLRCHHIVARTAKKAKEAQDKLKDLGIDLDDAINGAGLPGPIHNPLHTGEYYDWINRLSRNWNSKEEAMQGLREIADMLLHR